MRELVQQVLRWLGPDYDEAQVKAALNAMDERIDAIDADTDTRLTSVEARMSEFDVGGKPVGKGKAA